jgi:hypothetical protein
MADFTKIIDHPEKTQIISKLVSGENPKAVSAYLKDKYPKPDEVHLRVPATTLQEFLDTYADHHGYVKKIIQRDADSKIDKKIADSLMDTRAWRDRVVDGVKKEISYIDKLDHVLTILEVRSEQIFDMIQNDPENTRTDYVFTKYMELLMLAIEKGDKIRNDRPDIKIEHTYSVQMVEQQSVAFQNAIRRILERMGPEHGSLFMDLFKEEMLKMTIKDLPMPALASVNLKEIEKEKQSLDKLNMDVEEFDQKFIEEYKDEEPLESDPADYDPNEESDDF